MFFPLRRAFSASSRGIDAPLMSDTACYVNAPVRGTPVSEPCQGLAGFLEACLARQLDE